MKTLFNTNDKIPANMKKQMKYRFLAAIFLATGLFLQTNAGTYTVTNTNDIGAGSLREAIDYANALSDFDNIVFNIPGAGPHTINSSSYMIISNPCFINGYSQPGAYPASASGPASIKIIISNASSTLGFEISGTGIKISGLSMVKFNGLGQCAIDITNNNITIAGNYIGLYPDGTTAGPNYHGIYVQRGNNLVFGGPSVAERNVISGNIGIGLNLAGASPDVDNALIQNNYIGTDHLGLLDRGNGWSGIDNGDKTNTRILDNIISGNNSYAIEIDGQPGDLSYGIIIKRNRIGVGTSGNAIPNNSGILLAMTNNNIIGGSVDDANIIAYNSSAGIISTNIPENTPNTSSNLISCNSIYCNGSLGINLYKGFTPDGVTTNDAGDSDIGANDLQNFPVPDTAYLDASLNLVVTGNLNSLANGSFRLEFFSNSSCNNCALDPTGYGEGEKYLGYVEVTTDGSGNAPFTFTLPVGGIVFYKDYITATATNRANNSTSEFSKAKKVNIEKDVVTCRDLVSTYSIDPIPGATSYTWSVPASAVITAGAGTVSVTVDWTAVPAGEYEICVSATGTCGTCCPICLQVTRIVCDFGDAPGPYPTLLAGNGASHGIVAGLFLGAVAPDAESDGQPSVDAGFSGTTGDDGTGTPDAEDGVILPPSFVQGMPATITVSVTGAGGKLSSWIDWNGNGSWGDAGEQTTTDLADNMAGDISTLTGTITFVVNVPVNAVPGTSFARFRWSTQAGLTYTGYAPDGEVEDYLVTILAANPSWTLLKTQNPPNQTYNSPGDILTYDILLTNTGNVPVNSVSVTDPTATTGLAYVSGDGGVAGRLDVGEAWLYSATYSVTQADLDMGSYTNTATAQGIPAVGTLSDTNDSETVTGTQTPALLTEKGTAITTYSAVGEQINYTITVTNTGNVTVSNISLTDTKATVTCGASPYTLSPTQSFTCTAIHTVTQADLDAGFVTNIATATGTDTNGNPVSDVSNPVTVNATAVPGWTLTKTATETDFDAVGDVIHYTLTLDNTGNVSTASVTITDPGADPGSILFVTGDTDSDTQLDPTETWSWSAIYTIKQADLNGGHYNNTATVEGFPSCGTMTSTTASEDLPAIQLPSWALAKDAQEPDYDAVGDVIHYTLTLDNTGNVSIGSITITDTGADPGSVQYASGDTNTDTLLDPVETWIYNAQHTIVQADLDGGHYSNTATADGIPAGGTLTPTTASEDVPAVQNPSWRLNKDASEPSYGIAGDVLHYTLILTNTGNVSVSNIQMTDTGAMTGPEYVSGDDGDGLLEPAEAWTYSATYTTGQGDLNAGHYSNTATANGLPAGGTLTPTTASEDVPAIQGPGWTLKKEAVETGYDATGDVIHYLLTLDNIGNVSIGSITITDTGADAGSIVYLSGDTNTDTLLDPTETWTYSAQHTVTQADLDGGHYSNTATAGGLPAGGTLTPTTASEDVPAIQLPSWALVKDALETNYDAVGDVIHYTLTLDNTGNVYIGSVTITDTGADAGSIVYLSGDTNTDTLLDPTETWAYSAQHTVTQADLDGGHYSNTATAGGIPAGGTLTPTTASEDVPAIQLPSIVLDKHSDVSEVTAASQMITYTFVSTNTGNVTLSGVSVSDPKITTLSCGPVTLLPGESVTCTATYMVSQADMDAGQITNTATTTGTPPAGPAVTDDDGNTVTATQLPSLSVEKTTQVNCPGLRDEITYNMIVTNTGNVTLSNVILSDAEAVVTCSAMPYTLSPAGSFSCTGVHIVTEADLLQGEVTNISTAEGIAPQGGNVTATSEPVTVMTESALAVTAGSSLQTVCYGEEITPVVYTLGGNTTTVTVTGISGLEVDISGVSVMLSGIPAGNPVTATEMNYIVTVSNGCGIATATGTIRVVPLPEINPPAPICTGSKMIMTATPAGGMWTSSDSGIASIDPVSGLVTGVAPGSVSITYKTENNSCTTSVPLKVEPLPVITTFTNNSSVSNPICEGSTLNIYLTVEEGVSWVMTGTGGYTAFGTVTSTTIGYSPVTMGYAGLATLTVTGDITGCVSTATTTVYVNPLPEVTMDDAMICSGSFTQARVNTLHSGTWTSTATEVATVDASGMVTGTGPGTSTITFTDGETGCTGSAQVQVTPLPVVTLGSFADVCTATPPFELTGGMASGGTGTGTGTYSGIGVSGGVFDPAAAGAGTQTITYTWTDSNGCTGIATSTITVHPQAILRLTSAAGTDDQKLCGPGAVTPITYFWDGGANQINLDGLNMAPGLHVSFTDNPGGGQDIMIYGTASATVNYTLYTNGVVSPCENITLTGTITVNPVPELAIGDAVLCVGETTTVTASVAGTWMSSNELAARVEGNVVTAAGGGWASLIFTADGTGCSNTLTVTVNPLPVATAANNGPLCAGGDLQLTGGTAGLTSCAWIGPDGFTSALQNPFLPGVTESNGGTYTLTVTNSFGCISTATTTVVVNPLPEVTAGSNSPLCIGSELLLTAGTVTGTYTWELPNGTTITTTAQTLSIPDVTAAYAGTCTLTLTDQNGCSGTATTVVSFLPEPMISFGFNGTEAGHHALYTFCEGETVSVTLYDIYAGVAPFTVSYRIDGGTVTTVTGLNKGDLISSDALPVGTHTITVTEIRDGNNCTASDDFLAYCEATLVINPMATLTLEPGSGPAYQEICLGKNITPIIYRVNGGAHGFDLKVFEFGGLTVEGDIDGDDLIVTLSGTTSETVDYELTTDGTQEPCVEKSERITIVVNRIPQFTACPANIETVDDPGLCTAVVNYQAVASGSAGITYTYTFEGAGAATVSPTGSGTGSGADFRTGTTTVTIVASNDCGTATCTFTVKVKDTQVPVFTTNCNRRFEAATDWDKATFTMTSALWDAQATDNCSMVMSYSGNNGAMPAAGTTLSGTTFSIGETTLIWTVTDAGGNAVSCTSKVTVTDNQVPVISCAEGRTMSTSKGSCSYRVSGTEFDPLSVYDNDGIAYLGYSLDGGATWVVASTLSGTELGGGTNVILWKVTDPSGNTATCTTTVTLVDNEAPQFRDCCNELLCVTLKPTIIRNRFGVFIEAHGSLTAADITKIRSWAKDNCTPRDKLIFTISKTEFTADDAHDCCCGPNPVLIKVTVTDQSGNTTQGWVGVEVCLGAKSATIGNNGKVTIGDEGSPLQVNVYPNPTKGKLHLAIENLNDPKVKVQVYNMVGSEVYHREVSTEGNFEIDLTGNVSGMYQLRLIADRKEFIYKVILEAR